MTDELIAHLLEVMEGTRVLTVLSLVAIVSLIVLTVLAPYAVQRLRNLATKQDIEALTKMVETVKSSYAKELDDYYQRNRLALAALDRRLAAHQEGFAIWHGMMAKATSGGKELDAQVELAQEWWKNNSLYLDKDSREKFHVAIFAASIRSGLCDISGNADQRAENWAEINAAGEALVKGAGLPGFASHEKKEHKAEGDS